MKKTIITMILLLLTLASGALAVNYEKAQEQLKQSTAPYVALMKDDSTRYVYNPKDNGQRYQVVGVTGLNVDKILNEVYNHEFDITKNSKGQVVIEVGREDLGKSRQLIYDQTHSDLFVQTARELGAKDMPTISYASIIEQKEASDYMVRELAKFDNPKVDLSCYATGLPFNTWLGRAGCYNKEITGKVYKEPSLQ